MHTTYRYRAEDKSWNIKLQMYRYVNTVHKSKRIHSHGRQIACHHQTTSWKAWTPINQSKTDPSLHTAAALPKSMTTWSGTQSCIKQSYIKLPQFTVIQGTSLVLRVCKTSLRVHQCCRGGIDCATLTLSTFIQQRHCTDYSSPCQEPHSTCKCFTATMCKAY